MKSEKLKKYSYFIGIDVSRNKLDFAIMHGHRLLFHREICNNTSSIIMLLDELKTLPKFIMAKSLFCLEQTGFYGNHLLNALKKYKANVVVENALNIKKSLGIVRGKTDKLDAIRIALYCFRYKDSLRIYTTKRPVIVELAHLSTLRDRLKGIQIRLKAPLAEQQSFIKKGLYRQNSKLCKSSLKSIKDDIAEIDKLISGIIAGDDYLKRLNTIITSVPSVGAITALQIILSTNEFRNISNPKKFACYAGVVPFGDESGISKRKARISPIANKRVKTLLHTCAIVAVRFDRELKEYYKRKTEGEGKPKMMVLNAVRNKLVLRIFACVNQDRCFDKNYLLEMKPPLN